MPHTKFVGERTLMRIHIGESDKWHGKPLHEAIVSELRKENFSGVTVSAESPASVRPASITPTNCSACRRTCPSFWK